MNPVRLIAPAVFLAVSAPAVALEKSARRATDFEGWGPSATTCVLQYWNSCVGWVWTWGGWSPQDIIGVCFEGCCAESYVESMDIFTTTGQCAGYGFTGLLEAYQADENHCPIGAPIVSVPTLFERPTQIGNYPLGANVGSRFVVSYTHGPAGSGLIRHVTDFAAQGPTGPQGCGNCFPTTRVTNSYYYGNPASLLCPGSKLNDGTCDVEWRWTANTTCTVDVETETWGGVKNLYR